MRLLFFIEPLLMHNRPYHYWAWLDYSASIYRAFAVSEKRYSFRFIMNEALATRAVAPYDPAPRHPPARGQGLPSSAVIPLRQEPIREIFDAPNTAIVDGLHHGAWDPERLTRYGELIRDRLGDFVPDLIITRTPVPFLAAAFPDAVIYATECGPFSRAPYPMTTFLDPCGLWGKSLPGAHGDALLDRPVTDSDRALLNRIRSHYRPFFDSSSPFHGLEERMRSRFRRLAFLPLQFAGESGFDLNAPFRSQGEYLFHVLERMPEDLGLLVAEHPTAIWVGDAIDQETRDYVRVRYPQVTFVDYRRVAGAGQYLIHHVDYVICISSSLGLQAVLWDKPMVAVGDSPYRAFATFRGVDALDLSGEPAPDPARSGALAWLLRHYYTHESLGLHDAEWLDRFFRTTCDRLRAGKAGLELFEPIAPVEEVARSLCPPLPSAPTPAVRSLDGLLRNGDFARWTQGIGPFRTTGSTADYWELLPGAGNAVVVRPGVGKVDPEGKAPTGGRALSVERTKGGSEPTILLQRVSDVHRCGGAFLTLRFLARSLARAPLVVYAYQQFDHALSPARGTEPRVFSLAPEWVEYEYEAFVAATSGVASGPESHTEIVFLLPGEVGPASFDLARVEMY